MRGRPQRRPGRPHIVVPLPAAPGPRDARPGRRHGRGGPGGRREQPGVDGPGGPGASRPWAIRGRHAMRGRGRPERGPEEPPADLRLSHPCPLRRDPGCRAPCASTWDLGPVFRRLQTDREPRPPPPTSSSCVEMEWWSRPPRAGRIGSRPEPDPVGLHRRCPRRNRTYGLPRGASGRRRIRGRLLRTRPRYRAGRPWSCKRRPPRSPPSTGCATSSSAWAPPRPLHRPHLDRRQPPGQPPSRSWLDSRARWRPETWTCASSPTLATRSASLAVSFNRMVEDPKAQRAQLVAKGIRGLRSSPRMADGLMVVNAGGRSPEGEPCAAQPDRRYGGGAHRPAGRFPVPAEGRRRSDPSCSAPPCATTRCTRWSSSPSASAGKRWR